MQQRGNILISSLLILVTMSLLGIGLVQSSVKESQTATYKIVDSAVHQATEACTTEAIKWLEDLTAIPTTLPHIITAADLTSLYTGSESQEILNKLTGYSYTCTITEITNKTVAAQSNGVGTEMGDGGGYNSSASLSPKYYYEIESVGSGPNSSVKTLYTIVSVEY